MTLSVGDKYLDADGNTVLEPSGNIRLHRFTGQKCCPRTTVTATFSGIAACPCTLLNDGSQTLAVGMPFSGEFTIEIDAARTCGTTVEYASAWVDVATITQYHYQSSSDCTGSHVDLDLGDLKCTIMIKYTTTGPQLLGVFLNSLYLSVELFSKSNSSGLAFDTNLDNANVCATTIEEPTRWMAYGGTCLVSLT